MPATEITVGTSPTLLGTVAAGQTIIVQNTGSATLYASDEVTGSNLTTSNGLQVAAGGQLSEEYEPAPTDPQTSAWYGVVVSGTTTVVVDVIA